MSKDVDRVKVYRAEQQISGAFSASSGDFDFFGSKIYVQPETLFRNLNEIQQYADAVISRYVQRKNEHMTSVKVRARKGNLEAHYEYESSTIAIPTRSDWAMRELVILHEIAHHITWQKNSTVAAHGVEFLNTYLELVSAELGQEACLLLHTAFDSQGLESERGS